MKTDVKVLCKGCGKTPEETKEYISVSRAEKCTEEEFVKAHEGTYNRKTGKFWCNVCYIKNGMPLGKA